MNDNFENFIASIDIDDRTKQKAKEYFSYAIRDDNVKIDVLRKIMQYTDIFQEFKHYLLSEQIEETDTSVCERGFTAYSICNENPSLPVHTAFIYLARMRDSQEEADKIEELLKSKKLNDSLSAKLYQENHNKEVLLANIKQTLKFNYAYYDYNLYENLQTDKLIQIICPILLEKYIENPDIGEEYANVVENNITDYHVENPVNFNGYDAYKLYCNYPYLFKNNAGYLYAILVYLKNIKEKDIDILNIYKLLEYNVLLLNCAVYHNISKSNITIIENFIFKCNIEYETKKTILEQLLLTIQYENLLDPLNGNPSIKYRYIYKSYSSSSISELKKATDDIDSFDLNNLLNTLTSYTNSIIIVLRNPYERFDEFMNEYFKYLNNKQ